MQKVHRAVVTGCAGLVLLAAPGCVVTNPSAQQVAMEQQRQDQLYYQESIRILNAKVATLEQELYRMQETLEAGRTRQDDRIRAQLEGLNTALEDLASRIRAVDAARQADKQQMVDELSRQISTLLASQRPASRPATASWSGEGYEHTVQAGETLSAIASAYGSSITAIVQANNLPSADTLRVGQKLFIPAR